MDPILLDFESDLDRICHQLDFIEVLQKYLNVAPSEIDTPSESQFVIESLAVHEKTKIIHSSFPLVSGTLILYTCGRFEAMTRTLFEDLCQRLVARAGRFSRLPKKMRENLPIYTAKVISDPRKYGHGDGGVRSFVSVLATNLEPDALITRVNHQCLSITETNMRAEMLSDLFARVGADKIWTRIAEQAATKAFFEEFDTGKVEVESKKKLNELMDLRNKIAHPSSTLEWPSVDTIRGYVSYLKLIARALSDLSNVYEVTLCAQEVAPAQIANE